MVSLMSRRQWRYSLKLMKQHKKPVRLVDQKKDTQNEDMDDQEHNTSRDMEYEENTKHRREAYEGPGSERTEESRSFLTKDKIHYSHTKLISSLKREKRQEERSADDMNMKVNDSEADWRCYLPQVH